MLAMLANSFFKFDCRPSVWDKLSVRNTLGNYPPKGACEMNCNEGRKGQGVGGGLRGVSWRHQFAGLVVFLSA